MITILLKNGFNIHNLNIISVSQFQLYRASCLYSWYVDGTANAWFLPTVLQVIATERLQNRWPCILAELH